MEYAAEGTIAPMFGLSDGHWDMARVDADLRQSQVRRWVVHEALRDASERNMHNHMDLNVLERSKRFPWGQ